MANRTTGTKTTDKDKEELNKANEDSNDEMNKEDLNKENEGEGETGKEEKETNMEGNKEAQGGMIDLRTNKTGFWSDLGLGAKIGVGLVFTGIGVGLGFLLKGLLGGKDDDDVVPVEGSVSSGTEE